MDKTEKYWTDFGASKLEGKTIDIVRYLSEEESEMMGWSHRSIVLQLSDGTVIFPSTDDEGNNAGALFGQTKQGDLTFPVLR